MKLQVLGRYQLLVGSKHSMLVLYLIMLFQKYLWQLHVIFEMTLMGNEPAVIHRGKYSFSIIVFIRQQNLTLDIDSHVLVWLLLMNKM